MNNDIPVKKGSVGLEFLKRTAEHIVGATGDYIKDITPTTTSTISGARSTIREVTSGFNNAMTAVAPKIKELNVQRGFKAIFNWYMKKSDEFGAEGDLDSQLNFDVDGDSSPESTSQIQMTEWDKNAKEISKTVVDTSQKMVEAQVSSTANIMTSLDKQTSVISAGFDKTSGILNKILEVVTKNTSTLIETSVASKESARERSANDNVISKGFNFEDYKKMVISNFKNTEQGSMLGMLPMLMDLGKNLGPRDVLKYGIGMGVNRLAPNFKNNLKALDDVIGETITSSLIRLGESRDKYGRQGFLSEIFGLKADRKELNTARSSLELKSISYDTVSKEALTNAIPGYLRDILIALGGPDKIYDYHSRSFKSKASIKREFQDKSANVNTIYGASKHVRDSLGTDKMSNFIYDMMMEDLGSRTEDDEVSTNATVKTFKDVNANKKYLRTLLQGVPKSKKESRYIDDYATKLANAVSDGFGFQDIYTQAKRLNITRNENIAKLTDRMNAYDMDASFVTDKDLDNRSTILRTHNKGDGQPQTTATTEIVPVSEYSGVDYTNKVLYEIFRRLNTGINVFEVGSTPTDQNRQSEPFPEFEDTILPPPHGFKKEAVKRPKIENLVTKKNPLTKLVGGPSDGANLLQDQEGDPEGMTKGQKFARWGKHRGGKLVESLFSGDTNQIKDAFRLAINDITQVSGDQIKKGLGNINRSFGNISGFLKHKLMGTPYSFETGKTNPDGTPEMKNIAKQEHGGLFGYVSKNIRESFDKSKEGVKKWWTDVAKYFDYPSDDKDDKANGVEKKRKRFLFTSVGSMMGAGLLGGPLGLLFGAVAGNALSSAGIGDKIKRVLFGDKDVWDDEGNKKKGKKRGLIGGAVDKIVDPIRYQLHKTFHRMGDMLKKNILGPLSDIGFAIKDRIAHAAETRFGKLFGAIGRIVMAPFKGIASIIKWPIMAIGNTFRGLAEVGTGAIGAGLGGVANLLITKGGKSDLKARRREREDDIKYEKDDKGNFILENGKKVKKKDEYGFMQYDKWKRGENIRRKGSEKDITAYLQEKVADAAENTAKLTEKVVDHTEDTAKSTKATHKILEEERIPGNSFKTHDTILHEKMDKLLDIFSGKGMKKLDSVEPLNNIPTPNTPSIVPKNDPNKGADELARAALGAAATLSGSNDHMSDTESRLTGGLLDASTSDRPDKASIGKKLRELFQYKTKEKKENGEGGEEEEKESFISKLLKEYWPVIAGGMALFNEDFRNLALNLLGDFTGWLGNNLPTILAGAGKVAETANNLIENQSTGATLATDGLTGNQVNVMSAEEHAENIENGALDSALSDTLNLGRMSKDIGLMAGGRAVGRVVTGAIQGISGGIGTISGGIGKATSAIVNKFTPGLDDVAKLYGGGAPTNIFSKAGTALKGVSSAAGGIKGAFGKILNPKTIFSLKNGFGLAAGIGADISSNAAWEWMDTVKNANIVGDYGLGNAGGFVKTNTNLKTGTAFVSSMAASTAVTMGIAAALKGATIAAAIAGAITPVGWAIALTAIVIAIAAAVAALVNWLSGLFTDGANREYSVRSNASKLDAVLNNKFSTYKKDGSDPIYAYYAQESDRVIGLTKGMGYKNPEIVIGKYLRMIIDGTKTMPGSEVLLYDVINNMAVQGVPIASQFAGDSLEVGVGGAHANKDIYGDPPVTKSQWPGPGFTQVFKSDIRKEKKKIWSDIAANITWQDSTLVYSEEDLEAVYKAGKEIRDDLLKEGILKSNGEIDTGKFKGTPNSGKNDSGWTSLDKLTRKNGGYHLDKCIIYINSKIEANDNGEQWVQTRQNDIVKLREGLEDFFNKEKEEIIAEMKASGMSDEEIKEKIDSSSKKTDAAQETPPPTVMPQSSVPNLKTKIKDSAWSGIQKELKYITASYAYSHPAMLNNWVNANPDISGVDPADQNNQNIANWKTVYSGKNNSVKKSSLLSGMANAARAFANTQGDIFNLLPLFDWTEGGKIFSDKKEQKYGSEFVLRGEDKKPGEGILEKLWDVDKTVGSDIDPEEMHDELLGHKEHGQSSESTAFTSEGVEGSGVIGRIVNYIKKFGSDEGIKKSEGADREGWKNVIHNIPVHTPPNLNLSGMASSTPSGDNGEESTSSVEGGFGPGENEHIDLVNGFPLYLQGDGAPWADKMYGKSTMDESACGPTSMAMVLSGASGKFVNPYDVAQWSVNNGHRASSGTAWSFFKAMGDNQGLETHQSGPTQDFLDESLSNKKPVIISGKGSTSTPFTKGGHFVVAVGKKDDKYLINDPNGRTGQYSWSEMGTPRQMWSFAKNGKGFIGGVKPSDEELAAFMGIDVKYVPNIPISVREQYEKQYIDQTFSSIDNLPSSSSSSYTTSSDYSISGDNNESEGASGFFGIIEKLRNGAQSFLDSIFGKTGNNTTGGMAIDTSSISSPDEYRTSSEEPNAFTSDIDVSNINTDYSDWPGRDKSWSTDYQEPFILKIAPGAQASADRGVLPSVRIAQAITESGWGRERLATSANNLFGMKGKYNGQSVIENTREEDSSGNSYYVDAEFRKYPDWGSSIADQADNYVKTKTYAKHGVLGETDYVEAAKKIKASGYATDSQYAEKLIKSVQNYHLDYFDNIKNKPSSTSSVDMQYPEVEQQDAGEVTGSLSSPSYSSEPSANFVGQYMIPSPTRKRPSNVPNITMDYNRHPQMIPSTPHDSINTAGMEDLLSQLLVELKLITGNTDKSNLYLDSINQKEFGVDSGLREGLKSLGKINMNKAKSLPYNHGNVKTINSIIRP